MLIDKESQADMKLGLPVVCALVLCVSATTHAATPGDFSPAIAAGEFVDALQHRDYKAAAAMFAPGKAHDTSRIEDALERLDKHINGFSTMHPVAALPDGKTIKLDIAAHTTIASKVHTFAQLRYASVAGDGQPVFYELNLATDNAPSQVLSFGVHFPVSDAQSTARANHLVSLIGR